MNRTQEHLALMEFIFKVTQVSNIHSILVMVAKEKTNWETGSKISLGF